MKLARAAMLDTHLRSLGTNELFWSAAGLLEAQRVTVDLGAMEAPCRQSAMSECSAS